MKDSMAAWAPMSIADVVEQYASAPFRWWLSGGHALDLHVGRSWRAHDDIDVGVLRKDVGRLLNHHARFDIHLAAQGVLTPWTGQALSRHHHENNLWLRRTPSDPWCLDVTVSEGDDEAWAYRRDLTFRLPWAQAVRVTADGIPYLAPELQLLYKSKSPRPKDHADAVQVIGALSLAGRQVLTERLPPAHPWRSYL